MKFKESLRSQFGVVDTQNLNNEAMNEKINLIKMISRKSKKHFFVFTLLLAIFFRIVASLSFRNTV
jgi:hypothetical protein